MARPEWEGFVDLSEPDNRRRLMVWVGKLRDIYEISFKPRRPSRSNQQLRYYFPCIVRPFFDFLKENGWDVQTPDDAHDLLREKFLRVPMKVDARTGEALAWRTRRTRELDTAAFGEYVEQCRDWLLTQFDIVTMDPERDPAERKKQREQETKRQQQHERNYHPN